MNTLIQSQLEEFRKAYPSAKAFVEDDFIVYKVRRGTARICAHGANMIIQQNGWNLTAIPTEFPAQDCFWVQSNNTEH